MLTALDSEADVVQGLEAGADDYVTKPFGLAELRSRIRAVLRRAHGRVVDGVRSVGPVTIDQRERQVTVGGAAVRVTFSEYELLACLMERPGKLFTRQELLRAIWGDSAYRDPRAIDVHIRHLREKLEERPEEPEPDPDRPRRGLPLPGALRRARPRIRAAAAAAGRAVCSRLSCPARGAALALLPPLRRGLTDQAANDLENATTADAPLFQKQIETILRNSRRQPPEDRRNQLSVGLQNRAFTLRQRTDARVILTEAVPDESPVVDTDFAGSAVPRNEILAAISNPEARTVRRDNQVIVVQPIDVPASLSLNPVHSVDQSGHPVRPVDMSGDFVLVTQKQLTDVSTAVRQVRTAFLAAAAVGLARRRAARHRAGDRR